MIQPQLDNYNKVKIISKVHKGEGCVLRSIESGLQRTTVHEELERWAQIGSWCSFYVLSSSPFCFFITFSLRSFYLFFLFVSSPELLFFQF